MNEITMIDVNKISPHPDNPRKDLGDLTELTASVKDRGILQNLTVMPNDGGEGYTVLIGHRRLAAAKAAGLKTVPCTIAEGLTKQEQVEHMMLENIQRKSLTMREEAQGIQLMLDMGDTIIGICKKIHVSYKTAKSRLKLLEMPEKIAEKVEGGEIKLEDYERAAAIKDERQRQLCMDALGTNNFGFRIKNAEQIDADNVQKEKFLKRLNEIAEETDSTDGLTEVLTIYGYMMTSPGTFEKLDGLDTTTDADNPPKYFYTKPKKDWEPYRIYRPATAEELEQEKQRSEVDKIAEQERQRRQEHGERLKEISRRAFECRRDFALNANPLSGCLSGAAKLEKYALLCDYAARAMCFAGVYFDEYFEIGTGNVSDAEDEKIVTAELKRRGFDDFRRLFATTMAYLDANGENYVWQAQHEENEKLDFIYEFLCAFGYKMSDEEKALQDGTHELFMD